MLRGAIPDGSSRAKTVLPRLRSLHRGTREIHTRANSGDRSGQWPKELLRAQEIWRATQSGKLQGFFIVDYVIGKHLVIDYAVALSPDGKVKQIEILNYRESYGGEIRNPDWRKQFVGKGPRSRFALNDGINNIGGATLSCRHVTEGVRRVLATYEVCLK